MEKITQQIQESNYISRDLSWLQFNYRVLDQAKHTDRSIFDRLKFLSITASNLDEFFKVRVATLRRLLKLKKKTRARIAHHLSRELDAVMQKWCGSSANSARSSATNCNLLCAKPALCW